MKRLLVQAASLLVVATSSAAPAKVPLAIWGVDATDSVTIDGTPQSVKGGATRVFNGDPASTNAPVLVEVTTGKHTVVVTKADCAPRTFQVDVEGGNEHALILEKEDPERCAIPLLPARR